MFGIGLFGFVLFTYNKCLFLRFFRIGAVMITLSFYPNKESFPDLFRRGTAIALGNFDGVHLGHQSLIRTCVESARDEGLFSCVYTFRTHPAAFAGKTPTLITDNDEKEEFLQTLGVDLFFADDFAAVKDMSCADFCEKILIEKLACRVAVCGSNFSFGKGRAGHCETLRYEMEKRGVRVVVAPDVFYTDENGEKEMIHSTTIRRYIADGDMEHAERLLGRPFSIYYPVVHGRHLGTKIGIPTINQAFGETKLKPKNGVYACLCTIDGEKYIGLSDVGTKPTVTDKNDNPPILCETHILNYHGDLYGHSVKIEFFTRLRDEKKFASLDELVREIHENIETTKRYFEKRGVQTW